MTLDNKKTKDEKDLELWLSAVNPSALSKYDGDAAYEAFLRRKRAVETSHHSRLFRYIGAVAASVALLVGVSYFSFRRGMDTTRSSFKEIRVEAPIGSRTNVVLPDGSKVNLNAGSHLRYSQGFGIKSRDVSIEGEGFFEVVRNEDLPFRVSSPSILVEVLGTKFNFKDYPDDAIASVSLKEGRVSMENLLSNEEKLFLVPGDLGILNKEDGRMTISKTPVQTFTEWTEGTYVVRDLPLREIAKFLERDFGVRITFKDASLENLLFNGDFPSKGLSLTDVLDILGATNHFRYRPTEEGIEIY